MTNTDSFRNPMQVGVLFIIGSGHSGSTVLDLSLGRRKGVFSLGEVNRLHECVEHDLPCTCGKRVGNCRMWSEVLPLAKNEIGGFPQRNWEPNACGFERLESADPTLATDLWKLYAILGRVTQASWLVDSSKSPRRAALAVKAEPARSRVLWLTRDGRGVVHSLQKQGGLPIQDLAGRWLRTNQAAIQIVDSLENQAMHLCYEEFCAAPQSAIERILGFLNLDLEVAAPRQHRMAHTIAGNRCRYTFRKTIREDLSWRERLSREDVAQFESVAGELNRQLLGELFTT